MLKNKECKDFNRHVVFLCFHEEKYIITCRLAFKSELKKGKIIGKGSMSSDIETSNLIIMGEFMPQNYIFLNYENENEQKLQFGFSLLQLECIVL